MSSGREGKSSELGLGVAPLSAGRMGGGGGRWLSLCVRTGGQHLVPRGQGLRQDTATQSGAGFLQVGGAQLPPCSGALLSAVRAASTLGAPGGARGGFLLVGELRSASQGPSGQPAEACGGPLSPPLLKSAPLDVKDPKGKDPEGKERDRSGPLQEGLLDGNAVQPASGDVCLAFPVSSSVVRLQTLSVPPRARGRDGQDGHPPSPTSEEPPQARGAL